MKQWFEHYRLFDRPGEPLPHGGLTLAVEMQSTEAECVVVVATARCSILDNYDRRIGRAIAGGRLARRARRRSSNRIHSRAFPSDPTELVLREWIEEIVRGDANSWPVEERSWGDYEVVLRRHRK